MSLLFSRIASFGPSSGRCAARIGRYGGAVSSLSTSIPTSEKKSAPPENAITIDSNGDGELDFINGKPSLVYARKAMQFHSFSTMPHEQIILLSAEGVGGARREALIRNVMAVDNVEYEDATETVDKIAEVNRERMFLHALPYHAGVLTAGVAGVFSIPMVFHLDTVQAFNEAFVTADIPETKDLETWLEVGSWSWAWMEPLIGQASFFLLAMQFARHQLKNLGLKPYSDLVFQRRAERLVRLYPNYNSDLVSQFSEVDRYYHG
mmetsp:Transcript_14610/g.42036  ORF Transcript_14610/g.42036 Transcript_14610/m.42036 type:complete len:264 (-) Transcript_14610:5762-6553(-)